MAMEFAFVLRIIIVKNNIRIRVSIADIQVIGSLLLFENFGSISDFNLVQMYY